MIAIYCVSIVLQRFYSVYKTSIDFSYFYVIFSFSKLLFCKSTINQLPFFSFFFVFYFVYFIIFCSYLRGFSFLKVEFSY